MIKAEILGKLTRKRTVSLIIGLLAVVVVIGGLISGGPGGGGEAAEPRPASATSPSARGAGSSAAQSGDGIAEADLPPSARRTLQLIDAGGPFPYRQDGTTFGNREQLLPQQPSGYYREYTVPKPGADDRGPWRIVTGGDGSEEYYWTADHYESFQKIYR